MIDTWMDGCLDRWMDGRIYGRTDIDEWMEMWMNGLMNGSADNRYIDCRYV